jgi:hypothetical protein
MSRNVGVTMSDYIPKEPKGPNDPRGYDRYGNARFEPADGAGKGPYILLGLLVAIGLIVGLLYFNGTPKDEKQRAQEPPPFKVVASRPIPKPLIVVTECKKVDAGNRDPVVAKAMLYVQPPDERGFVVQKVHGYGIFGCNKDEIAADMLGPAQ